MYPIRVLFTLAGVLAGSLLVAAAPLESRAVHGHDVHVGSVFRASPVHFTPEHPGNSVHTGSERHPVVAVGHPNSHGYVPVVSVSHNHPDHMTDNVHGAHHYDRHTEKKFQPGSGIAVGNPVHVHKDDLHYVGHNSHLPQQLHHNDAHSLAAATYGHHYANSVVPHVAETAHYINQEHQAVSHAQGQHAHAMYSSAHHAAQQAGWYPGAPP